MYKPFSKRGEPRPTALRFDVPRAVRQRILAVLQRAYNGRGTANHFLGIIGQLLLEEYGSIELPDHQAVQQMMLGPHAQLGESQVLEHFLRCGDDQALDYVELWFRVEANQYWGQHDAVERINEILGEEGIGYSLTGFLGERRVPGDVVYGADACRTENLPRMIRRDHELIHETLVKPALHFLSNPKFQVANSEMLKAHSCLRHGDFPGAITAAGSSLESTLRTIATEKCWAFEQNATAHVLLEVCRKSDLFPTLYKEILQAVPRSGTG